MESNRKIKAESFDLMQYLYSKAHEPLIHGLIRFNGHMDEDRLKEAVSASLKAVPVVRCCFDVSTCRPCWIARDFTGEDIVHILHAGPDETEDVIHSLAATIDIFHEPQLKIFLIKGANEDTLCAVINHMVCDGAGFKEYLYVLAALYTDMGYQAEIADMKFRSRSAGQLLKGMGLRDRISLLFVKYDLSKQRQTQAEIHFEGDKGNPLFVTRKLYKDDLSMVKEFGRNNKATVNDILVTTYVRFLSRQTGMNRIIIPCPVDMRRYLQDKEKSGICNLTSNYICDIPVAASDTFRDTLSEVSRQMREQKESRHCLKSIMMLESSFKLLPFWLLRRNFSRFFTIPVTSFTNFGVIDEQKCKFGDFGIKEVFLTGAVKYTPYFQLAASTFDGVCTLSCNLYGTSRDREQIEGYLDQIADEICTAVKPR